MTFEEKKKIIYKEYPKVGCDYKELANRLGYKNVSTLSATAQRIGAKYKNTIFETEQDEIFRPINDDLLKHYRISNYGKVINSDGVLLKSQPHHQTKYLQISLMDKKGNKVTRLVHVLVAKTFLGPKPNDTVCDHIDGDRGNVALKNLRYITQSENVKRQPVRQHNGYLSDLQVQDICKKLENGMSISKITKTDKFYTKSMVEKIKQKVRHLEIVKDYNF